MLQLELNIELQRLADYVVDRNEVELKIRAWLFESQLTLIQD